MSLQGEIASYYRGQGSDFYRIRPYEALESAHHVDWKATAHTGDLQVREFSREREQAVAFFLDLDTPSAQTDWFESAVDRCAFLTWNLSQRGSRIRFCTQEVDWQLPEDGDVYTILKYLAIVAPRQGRRLPVLQDQNVFQIVFSACPDRLVESGWEFGDRNTRLLAPEPEAVQAGSAQK